MVAAGLAGEDEAEAGVLIEVHGAEALEFREGRLERLFRPGEGSLGRVVAGIRSGIRGRRFEFGFAAEFLDGMAEIGGMSFDEWNDLAAEGETLFRDGSGDALEIGGADAGEVVQLEEVGAEGSEAIDEKVGPAAGDAELAGTEIAPDDAKKAVVRRSDGAPQVFWNQGRSDIFPVGD